MQAFWAIMHLVAAALLVQDSDAPDMIVTWRDGDRTFLVSDEDFVERYAVLLGMPADEAFVMALCRGDRRKAFEE